MWDVRLARADELEDCLAIRREVFIVGQNVPEALEVDGLDSECAHVIAKDGRGQAVGTARLRVTDDGDAKAERVAVLQAARGRGLGARLMDELERYAQAQGHGHVLLSAQTQVLEFYRRRGYQAFGPQFDEAGIPHRKMRLSLGTSP